MRDMRFSGSKIFVVLLMIVITCFSVLMFDISDESNALRDIKDSYCIGTKEDGGFASDIWQNDYGYFDKALLNELYAKSTGIEEIGRAHV